jgi:hypothetical protein
MDSPVRRGYTRETTWPARRDSACYVFLVSADSTYMSGQVLQPNGGEIING